MTDKPQPLSGAAPAPEFHCETCQYYAFSYKALLRHKEGFPRHTIPAAPVAVPAQPREKCEVGMCQMFAKTGSTFCVHHHDSCSAAPAPLPPPQEPRFKCVSCNKLTDPLCAECIVATNKLIEKVENAAALAGETRTEADDSMLIHILVQKEKEGKGEEAWVAHCLELDLVGVDDSKWKSVEKLALLINRQIDFAIRNGREDAIWFPAPQQFFDKYVAAAASRIAQLEEQLEGVIDADCGRCAFNAQKVVEAEAALTQAQQERDELKRKFQLSESVVASQARNMATDRAQKSALMEAIEPFAKAECTSVQWRDYEKAARVYEQVKEKI